MSHQISVDNPASKLTHPSPINMISLPSSDARRKAAFDTRVAAARIAKDRIPDVAVSNGEESLYNSRIASFTKGLHHDDNGLIVNDKDFKDFVNAANSGDEDTIANLPLGPPRDSYNNFIWRSNEARSGKVSVRGWESMSAGLAYDLQGPDSQTHVMPPAPTLTSDELAAEMAEVYLLALARDIPISKWSESNEFIRFAIEELNKLPWFANKASFNDSPEESFRRRGRVTINNIFRGLLPGSLVGPYLSQFLIGGSNHIVGDNGGQSGIIQYGSITINQRTRIAKSGKDFMTTMDYFLDVQDGADLRRREEYERGVRLISTLRDMATYVHFDALYEAYLNATLIMLANEVPFDSNLPFTAKDSIDKQQGFALYGGPHILTLVTEVATRALKAVRFSKFNVHRRTRPEAVGGLIHKQKTEGKFPEVQKLVKSLDNILDKVCEHNEHLNGYGNGTYLLPMAFSEGSPMHPSYGSGHATVAGACVTILKAFFNENHVLKNVYEVDPHTDTLVKCPNASKLTVGGELEKLADNISIGRDVAGVHYFSDQWESLLLGEKIALGLLEETRLTYRESFKFSLTKFDRTPVQV